jgi:6-pyruvoyltetrahydropterin/6-carboxytetrahydropterin synthase
MYEIIVEQHFEAAHFLRGYKGKCEHIHGHRYAVKVRLQSSQLNDIGLAFDFTDVKRHMAGILGRYDHLLLNDISPFDKQNPSAENIARTIYQDLAAKLKGEPILVFAVEVWENPQQGVAYTPD